ncbi:transcriptional regulator [Lysinibacillus fusiformis]|uniref:transcriptional regulator n=1 Tax=Lysinibacillus fusiformis TaxID=28031 RepID=UPI0023A99843|nr:transcriptional regulator [Lysinibacillus fusiformis]WEA41638.1 transcriptional regulator [Lysinibacillus fusiformis]
MILPSKSIATEHVNERFEKVSTDIFYYVQLGFIKSSDVALYIKYLELFNPNYGYAFPTIYQLEDYLNCSRSSIMSANKRLVAAGLIMISKYQHNNNIYLPLQPLRKEELAKQIPNKVKELEKRQMKIYKIADQDKNRFAIQFDNQSHKHCFNSSHLNKDLMNHLPLLLPTE